MLTTFQRKVVSIREPLPLAEKTAVRKKPEASQLAKQVAAKAAEEACFWFFRFALYAVFLRTAPQLRKAKLQG